MIKIEKPAVTSRHRTREDIHETQFDCGARVAVGLGAFARSAQAGNVIDEWASIKRPPPPALKAVTVDPKTTALLMLDFMNQNCGKRPACVASVPDVKKLLDAARAAKATVVYSFIAKTTAADVIKDVAPLAGRAACDLAARTNSCTPISKRSSRTKASRP